MLGFLRKRKIGLQYQFGFVVYIIVFISAICYLLSGLIDYKSVALILLVTVSLLAMFFEIFPVLLAALLSAAIWDFVFIHPRFSFLPTSTDDSLMLMMYFVVASLNAVLTLKIREAEKIARQKEEKANAVKLYNDLLNSLSHELRTPISTIIGTTDNLLDEDKLISYEERRDLLTEISLASLKLNQQVENLLNMSRIESGFIRAKMDWCDVTMLIYDEINLIEDNIKNQKLEIIINENLPSVRLDYGLMQQIINNLIQNAIMYTPDNSTIWVTANLIGDNFVLIVEDNGKGFPEEEISHVFDKFYRLKNSKPGGTGLGLSIVKGFVEAQGGTITLSNRITGGAKFEIKIKTQTTFLNN